MRHLNRGRKLNCTPAHRRAMMRNLVTSLFLHGRVVTTPAKAKEARPFAEKLITLAKKGSLHDRRRAVSLLHDKAVVASLFTEIGPRYKTRPGGYCRILHMERTRIGDGAPQALFELVEADSKPKKKRGRKPKSEKAAPEAAAETAAPAGDAETPADNAQA